ncbi:MAG: hypothetical protein QNJ56_09845 [Gammaproteobacteria bacterium]|nr:hypothetical protein [Gammaproteobacteria bacterium]
MKLKKQHEDRAKYYDRLVKKIVVYGAAAFFAVGTVISQVWIGV